MTAKPEITMTATEFKAKCLNLMDRIAAGTLARVRVTKRGKVAAELVGADIRMSSHGQPFHGFLKGKIAVNPDFDWGADASVPDAFQKSGDELVSRATGRTRGSRRKP